MASGAAFRDWCAGTTDVPDYICEAALAHISADRVHAAYRAVTWS